MVLSDLYTRSNNTHRGNNPLARVYIIRCSAAEGRKRPEEVSELRPNFGKRRKRVGESVRTSENVGRRKGTSAELRKTPETESASRPNLGKREKRKSDIVRTSDNARDKSETSSDARTAILTIKTKEKI